MQAVEKLRRRDRLDRRLDAGRLRGRHVRAVARALEALHASAEPCSGNAEVGPVALAKRFRQHADALAQRCGGAVTDDALPRLLAAQQRFRIDAVDTLLERASTGRVRRLHGRISCRNVAVDRCGTVRLAAPDPDARGDVTEDVAALAIDLRARGAARRAEAFAAAYAWAADDYSLYGVLDGYERDAAVRLALEARCARAPVPSRRRTCAPLSAARVPRRWWSPPPAPWRPGRAPSRRRSHGDLAAPRVAADRVQHALLAPLPEASRTSSSGIATSASASTAACSGAPRRCSRAGAPWCSTRASRTRRAAARPPRSRRTTARISCSPICDALAGGRRGAAAASRSPLRRRSGRVVVARAPRHRRGGSRRSPPSRVATCASTRAARGASGCARSSRCGGDALERPADSPSRSTAGIRCSARRTGTRRTTGAWTACCTPLARAARASSSSRPRLAFGRAWQRHMDLWSEGVASGARDVAVWAMHELGALTHGARLRAARRAPRVRVALEPRRSARRRRRDRGGARARRRPGGADLRHRTDAGPCRARAPRTARIAGRSASADLLRRGGRAQAAPDIFRAALDALGIDAAGAFHVGDLLRTDVAGARNAGMRSVRLRAAHDDATDLPEADHVADSHAALRTILGVGLSAGLPHATHPIRAGVASRAAWGATEPEKETRNGSTRTRRARGTRPHDRRVRPGGPD